MNAQTHTYKEVQILNIYLKYDGSCRRGDPFLYHRKGVINKMACYSKDASVDFISELYDNTSNQSLGVGRKLFVSSECKTGRDTFRNSDYTITRDIDKASIVVVPDVKSSFYERLTCDIVAKDEEKDELYLVHLKKNGYSNPSFSTDDFDRAKKYLHEAMGLVPDEVSRENMEIWFIPKCEEMESVITGTCRNVPYVQESLVPVEASTKISVETLTFWKSIPDKFFLARTICTSNWYDYPMTVLLFLFLNQNNENWYNYANSDFRRVLNQIGYSPYSDLTYLLPTLTVSPKDYDMLQEYMYSLMGLGPEGGVIDPNVLKTLPKGVNIFLQRKMVFKPMRLPTTMNFSQIRDIVQ